MDKTNPLTVVIIPFPLSNKMAGAKRLRALFYPQKENKNLRLYNYFFYVKKEEKLNITINNIDSKSFFLPKRTIWTIMKFGVSGFKYLKKCKNKSGKNILYHYSNPDIKTILIIVLAKLIGYKIVFDLVEDVFTLQKSKSFKVRLRFFFSKIFVTHIKIYSNGLIAISSHLERLATKLTKGKVPVLKIPVSILKHEFIESKNQTSNDTIKIFYGGSFGEKDGLDFLLRAFDVLSSEINNLELILTGRGSDYDMKKFKNILDSITNIEKVKYLGFLSDSEYNIVLQSADIYCMTRINTPYANAGFPFKLGEFLATGKPVVATVVGEVTSYLDKSNSYLIEPESVEDIVYAIKDILNHPEKAKKMGNNGKKVAFKYFDAKEHSSILYKFLKEI